MYVEIKSINFTQDNSHLVLHKNERVEIWDINTSKLRTTVFAADIGSRISSVTVVPALSSIIVGGAGIAVLIDLDGKELQNFYHPRTKIDLVHGQRDHWIISACISYEDALLITGSYQKIFVWDMDTCHLKFELSYKFPKSRGWDYDYHTVHHLALFSGNRFLISAGMFGDTFLWDFQERKLLHDLLYLKDWKLLPEYGDAGYQDVSILRLPNEKYVLLCVDYLYVVHLATGTTFGAIDTPNLEWRTYNAKMSIDENVLVLVGEYISNPSKPKCLVIDLRNLELLHEFDVPSIRWSLSPDGRFLVFAQDDKLLVQNAKTLALINVIDTPNISMEIP